MSSRQGHLANPAAQDTLRQRQRVEEKQRDADLLWVLDDARGRRFLWALIFDRCAWGDVYQGVDDAGAHRFNGRRQVGMELSQECQRLDPDAWAELVRERMEELQRGAKVEEAAKAEENDDA